MDCETRDYDVDLPPQEFAFTFRGEQYVLKEPGAGHVAAWRNAVFGAQRPDGQGGSLPAEGFADTPLVLLQQCVCKRDAAGADRALQPGALRGWSQRVAADLFARAKRMAGIGEDMTPQEVEDELARLTRLRERLLKEGPPAKKQQPGGGD